MKILCFSALFKLPDDFVGNLGDALQFMLDYHKSKSSTTREDSGPPHENGAPITLPAKWHDLDVEKFLHMIESGEKKLALEFAVIEKSEMDSSASFVDIGLIS